MSKYRCRLDKEDPRYLASSYEKVDLGWEWKFGDNGYGGYYGNDDDNELPTMVRWVGFVVAVLLTSSIKSLLTTNMDNWYLHLTIFLIFFLPLLVWLLWI